MADSEVSVEKRCQLLGLPRASFYRGLALGLRSGDLELMSRIDKLYLEHPWMGSRTLSTMLTTPEQVVGRDRVRRLMRIMGIGGKGTEARGRQGDGRQGDVDDI
jgi:putative transposase